MILCRVPYRKNHRQHKAKNISRSSAELKYERVNTNKNSCWNADSHLPPGRNLGNLRFSGTVFTFSNLQHTDVDTNYF